MIATDTPDVGIGLRLQLRPEAGEEQALVATIDAWATSRGSPHTRRAYRRAIERLIEEYGEVNAGTLAQMRDDMADKGTRPSTVRQAMVGVLSCTRWMVQTAFIDAGILPPLERVDRPRGRDTRPPCAPTSE